MLDPVFFEISVPDWVRDHFCARSLASCTCVRANFGEFYQQLRQVRPSFTSSNGVLLFSVQSVVNSQSFETGFSDCHHLIYTVLRFRDCKKFSKSQFLSDLTGGIVTKNAQDLAELEHILGDTLDRHAPHKTVLVGIGVKS